ncbi:uncharacterized protein [Watersipora subatra]|uniref:uncharacterized protein n=1 Tax=Watersipora subatra TaxID=2589382 RepID=UPI00355BA507
MDLSETRARHKRKFPNFMYGSTFPRDAVGAGGPSYGGALEWIQKHQDYLNQSLRYIQRYPNIVQEPVLDPFWDLLEPLVHNNNLLVKYDEFLNSQFGLKESYELCSDSFGQQLPTPAAYFKTDTDTRSKDYTYPIRRVFFCYDRTSAHHQSLKHLIVDQLEPFLSIRTNPTPEQAKVVNSLDICRAICGSTFILLLNDTVLNDEICLNLLSIAIAYKSPMIFIRESGYALPSVLPESKIVYVKIPEAAPFTPTKNDLSVNSEPRKKTLDEQLQEVNVSEEEEEDVGVQLLKERERKEIQRKIDAELSVSLSNKIRQLFKESLIFNPQMIETTLAILYDKLASYTGTAFPGSIPSLATEAATELSKPFNIGAMRLPEKPIYRTGSAKTTKGFHDTLREKRQNINANNNHETVDVMLAEIETSNEQEEHKYSDDEQIYLPHQHDVANRVRQPNKALKSPLHFQTFPNSSQCGFESHGGRIIMVPNPPKMMRSGNLYGQLTDPYRSNGFRPSYPSDSRLLKYRPNSSLPFANRSRVLLRTSIQRDHTPA